MSAAPTGNRGGADISAAPSDRGARRGGDGAWREDGDERTGTWAGRCFKVQAIESR